MSAFDYQDEDFPEWTCDKCGLTAEETEVDPHGTTGMCVDCSGVPNTSIPEDL